ncbi:MAG: class I SAM-dependent methyltransferase [Nitrospiraceae bacterium]|nr:MAG: class I SAM-dependent methyltransferase [Nitrospiraceae bacterium]
MLKKIARFICCPDDGSAITLKDGFWECLTCKRKSKILADNFLEILPSVFPAWDLKDNEPQKSGDMYQQEFNREFSWEASGGWGDLSYAPPGTSGFYKSEMEKIRELLNPASNAIAIDVSGAVGNYSRSLSDKVATMVNCDLHAPSIITAHNRRADNMVCIRTPYLKLPFVQNTFDYAICTDTLIRGWNHEVKLLKEILRVLKPGGKAIVDFHNRKWFAKNRDICAYALSDVKRVLAEASIGHYSVYPFGYVPLRIVPSEFIYSILDNIAGIFLPCKRHIVIFTKVD